MKDFNVEYIFMFSLNMAMINSAKAITQANEESKIRRYEAALVAKRQNEEHLKQLEIFNSRTKS